VPFLTGLAAMTAAPTRNFGVALAQGLGTGAQTYMGTQQQQATIGKTQAETDVYGAEAETNRANRWKLMHPIPPGYAMVPGAASDPSKTFSDWNNQPVHLELMAGKLPSGSVSTSSIAPPIHTDYTTGQVNIGPSSVANEYIRKMTDGAADLNSGAPVISSIMKARFPGTFDENEQLAQREVDSHLNGIDQADSALRNLREIAIAINNLPDTGFGASGANQKDRANLVNIYQTARRVFGLPDDPDAASITTPSQIIAKLQTFGGAQAALQFGEKAARAADALTQVFPGGNVDKKAANNVVSNMFIQEQQLRDFSKYKDYYYQKTGTYQGAWSNFSSEFNPLYDAEKVKLPLLFGKNKNQKSSSAEDIQLHPEKIQQYEQGGKDSKGNVLNGYGEGISRYLR
jgi:hypothetical protein